MIKHYVQNLESTFFPEDLQIFQIYHVNQHTDLPISLSHRNFPEYYMQRCKQARDGACEIHKGYIHELT